MISILPKFGCTINHSHASSPSHLFLTHIFLSLSSLHILEMMRSGDCKRYCFKKKRFFIHACSLLPPFITLQISWQEVNVTCIIQTLFLSHLSSLYYLWLSTQSSTIFSLTSLLHFLFLDSLVSISFFLPFSIHFVCCQFSDKKLQLVTTNLPLWPSIDPHPLIGHML